MLRSAFRQSFAKYSFVSSNLYSTCGEDNLCWPAGRQGFRNFPRKANEPVSHTQSQPRMLGVQTGRLGMSLESLPATESYRDVHIHEQ
ncbi:hypothetical protein PoB_007463300 [Plakobranchus ocellatus]|uniref:Uncharacterized protein n=1 Tax=Plakobranchus ocellatus TaxID=259542 RepID=A0AAV4DVM0_9GAST|nr:hypothetical protein PoB_007463300 [Plakobranchus ocellatus]